LAEFAWFKWAWNNWSNRSFFKIDNFMLSDILNTTREVEESPDTLFFNIKHVAYWELW
jgi:hypothetical protein